MSKSDLQVNNFGFIIRLMDCRSLLINSINRDHTGSIVEAKIIITFGLKLFRMPKISIGSKNIAQKYLGMGWLRGKAQKSMAAGHGSKKLGSPAVKAVVAFGPRATTRAQAAALWAGWPAAALKQSLKAGLVLGRAQENAQRKMEPIWAG